MVLLMPVEEAAINFFFFLMNPLLVREKTFCILLSTHSTLCSLITGVNAVAVLFEEINKY